MRLASVGILLSFGLAQAACIDHPNSPALPDDKGDSFGDVAPPTSDDTTQNPGQQTAKGDVGAKAIDVIKEEVYVLMKDWDDKSWMCTGTLVAPNVVLTAAHCLDDSEFASWEIVAPFADGEPRVSASSPQRMSTDYNDDPGSPDIGFLWLDEAIDLPEYAKLTDLSGELEKGGTVKASAVVRSALKAEAQFKSVDNLDVSSSVDRGYTHGVATPLFSQPGDSGAGLFLIENGKVTHKLIGVERQPEKDENLDHFTRVDADFLRWFHDNTGE